jgi:hypothetical protein
MGSGSELKFWVRNTEKIFNKHSASVANIDPGLILIKAETIGLQNQLWNLVSGLRIRIQNRTIFGRWIRSPG